MLGTFMQRAFRFYKDGFSSMTIGRTLWLIVLVKLLIMFGVLRVFFFPRFLEGSEQEKRDYVSTELIDRAATESAPSSHPTHTP